MTAQPKDSDTRIVDDKIAEARERIDRIAGEAAGGDGDISGATLAGRSDADLRKASADLKARIDAEKRRHDMPVDAALGAPDWEARAADGRLDLPDADDD